MFIYDKSIIVSMSFIIEKVELKKMFIKLLLNINVESHWNQIIIYTIS